ncbi:MAG: hypothetical protein JW876_02295 [Candidatus Krumholzibacteriota bacterium]|nr:hypothetical protein [Candidatus Krumholzibacteriota bacterium]
MNRGSHPTWPLLVAALLALAVTPAFAAQPRRPALDPAIRFIDRARVPSGILYDLVLPLSGIERFDGSPGSPALDLGTWKQIHYELSRAALDAGALPAQGETLRRGREAARAGWIPVAIIDARYDRVVLRDGGPVDIAAAVREGRLRAGRVFAAAPLDETTFSGERVRFRFDPALVVGNLERMPARIEVDPGDGGGWRPAAPGGLLEARYRSRGDREVRLRCIMPGGEVLEAGFVFHVAALATPAPHDTMHVTASVPWNGEYGEGDAYVYLADSLAGLQNPVIVVEGFDIDNSMGWEELYDLLAQENLIERARAEGFDLVVLDFADATDYIQRNALVVAELVGQVQAAIPPSRDLALIGASMGGLAGRYALAWMETAGSGHRVRTFISFDAPHRGADIPLGLQYWVSFFSVESAEAAELLAGLDSPAARQLLLCHHTDPPGATGESDPLRAGFEADLAAVGGYPASPRLVAFANGSGHGAGLAFVPGEQIVLYDYNGFLVDIVGNVWAVPDGGSHIVFDGLIDRPWPLSDDELAVTVSGTLPWDDAPGGTRASMAQMDSTEAPYGDIVALYDSHCFIPVTSALDLDTADLFHDVAADPAVMAITPFDTLYWAETNEEHVTISAASADRALDEVKRGVTGVDEDGLPAAALVNGPRNAPNPFNPSTTISFRLPRAGRVDLRIYGVDGALVRILAGGTLPGGRHEIAWDGLDDRGRPAASGVFFCRLRACGETRACTMVLIR